jgi:hypothetical protein
MRQTSGGRTMIRTEILDTDPKTGERVEVSPDFRASVQRASTILEADLPADDLEITARWQFVRRPDQRLSVVLDLTTDYEGRAVGYTGYPFDAVSFADDGRIRRSLRSVTWNFRDAIGHMTRLDIKQIGHKLSQLQPLRGE